VVHITELYYKICGLEILESREEGMNIHDRRWGSGWELESLIVIAF